MLTYDAGYQESCELNVYSPTPINTLSDQRNASNSAKYTALSPGSQPVEIVAEYTWVSQKILRVSRRD